MDALQSSVRTATEFMNSVVENVGGIRLEEVEAAETGWFITLSYLAPPDSNSALATFQLLSPRRLYKRFHVVDGVIRSMKIREAEDA